MIVKGGPALSCLFIEKIVTIGSKILESNNQVLTTRLGRTSALYVRVSQLGLTIFFSHSSWSNKDYTVPNANTIFLKS